VIVLSKVKKIGHYEHLFDRRRAAHPWFSALSRLENAEYPENRALAGNWRMDHRVVAEREEELRNSPAFHDLDRHGVGFDSAIQGYFQEALCRSGMVGGELPAYVADANRDNRIERDRVAPNAHLLHLASLEGLLRRVPDGFRFDVENALFELTGEYAPEDLKALDRTQRDGIARGLQRAGFDAIREFAGLVADALGPTQPHWWAAFAYEVDDYLEGEDWSRAARVLGLGHLREGDWLLAWRYPVDWAGPLYRPTAVEAAQNGWHYPSPPGEPFGVTMPLAADLPAVKEVIHAPLKGDVNSDACLGRLGRIVTAPTTLDNPKDTKWLERCRLDHAGRLHEYYETPSVANWLTRHGLRKAS